MAGEVSFDVVSDFDEQELRNALDQVRREVQQRYDFKGAHVDVDPGEGQDRPRDGLRHAREGAQGPHRVEGRARGTCRSRSSTGATSRRPAATRSARRSSLRRGLPDDLSRKLVKQIRDEFPKVQPRIQGDAIRVAGKSKDELQRVIDAGSGSWTRRCRSSSRTTARPRDARIRSHRADGHDRRRRRGHRRACSRAPSGRPPSWAARLHPRPSHTIRTLEFTPHDPGSGRTAVPAGRQEVAMQPHTTTSPSRRLDGTTPRGRPVRRTHPRADPDAERGRASPSRRWTPARARARTPVREAPAAESPTTTTSRAPTPTPTTMAATMQRPPEPAERRHDRRRAHRRDAARRRRPDRVHRPRRELPGRARRARGRRHPHRRDAPRGCRRVRRGGVRPADRPSRGLPRHARRRRREPRDRHPHGDRRLDADVRPRRPGRSRPPRPRGVPGGRPRRHDRRRSPSGPGEIDDPATAAATLEAAVRATVEGRPGPGAPEPARGRPRPAAPGRAPRTPVVRSHPDVPNPADVRAVLHFLAAAERPVILAGAGVLRARCSNDLVRFAEQLHVPGHRVVAPGRRHPQRPPAVPRHGRVRGAGRRARPARVRRRAARHRLPAQRAHDVRVPAPRPRPALDARRPRAAHRAPSGSPSRRRSRSAPTRGRSCAPPTRGSRRRSSSPEPVAARDAHNAADRAAWEAATVVDADDWSGPGVHPGRIIAELRRLLPDDAIVTTDAGAFGGWAARGLPVPAPGDVPRPDVGRDGLRLPGRARGGARPPRAAGRRAHRRRRHGDDAGRGRDGGPRGRPRRRDRVRQRALRDDPRPPGAAPGARRRPATDLGPLDFAAAARACGARGRAGRDGRRVRGRRSGRRSPPRVRPSSSSCSTGAGSTSTGPRRRAAAS